MNRYIRNFSLTFFTLFAFSLSCENMDDPLDETSANNPFSSEGDDGTIYEAEQNSSLSGCKKATNHSGFTGSGFMDFGSNGTWIEWNDVTAIQAGEYTLTFRYANGGASARQAAVLVNGQNAGNAAFAKTGSWASWKTDSLEVSLRQGNNTIRVKANTGSGGPNLDHMVVIGEAIVDNCPNDPNKTEPGECGCGAAEGTCATSENVALGKSTSQSSTGYSGVSSRAVDGNTSGIWREGSVTHTNTTSAPWWQVDLGAAYRVDGVTLFNRTDCCSSRLSNFHVDYLDEAGKVIAKKDHSAQATTKTNISLSAQGVFSVRIQLYGTNPLSLAEVQVKGTPDAGGTSLCTVANERSSAMLSCPSNETIKRIDFASYGLPTGSCDTLFDEGTCHAASSQSKVENSCLNKQSCTVAASNGIFGDPCSGKAKRLAIEYTCSSGDLGDDLCPSDPNKTEPGECGCGKAEGTCGPSECTNTLLGGEILEAGEYLCSENGVYQFGMSEQGNLALLKGSQVLWSADTCCGSAFAAMQGDGNLVVYDGNVVRFASKTHGNPGATLTLDNDGRVSIRVGSTELWSTGSIGKITHVGTTEVWDANGQDIRIARPSGSTTGDLLVMVQHRTDDDLPLYVEGWTRVAECYKSDNPQNCRIEDSCAEWHNDDFCKYFGTDRWKNGNGQMVRYEGHDLAQSVFYKVVGSNEPSSYSFNLNRDSSGHPGWIILTALRGADTNNPVREWSYKGCDGNADSIFPSVYGQKGDMVLLSQSFDDKIAQSKFGAPDGTSTFGYVSNSDEAGFLFGGVLDSTGQTGTMRTNGDGGPSCKDVLVSLTIKPR